MSKTQVAVWSELKPGTPAYAIVAGVGLVVVRWPAGDEVSVLYGRCKHRGALMSDGYVKGENIVCGVHNWDYQIRTGISSYNSEERLEKFSSGIDGDEVWVDEDEVAAWAKENPQAYDRDGYQGLYQDLHGTSDEPHTGTIRELANHGLEKTGHHGPMAAMGVPGPELPRWADIQIVTAQLARLPRLDDEPVATDLTIGPNAKRPLRLDIPLFVSDMSFGALSEEAKVALSKGAELTGTGGHLPGDKVRGKIAKVRGLPEGTPAISPPRLPDWDCEENFRDFANEVREVSGGIPIGVKLSAQHIEADIDSALRIGVDYIILDGRGGGTGAAPLIFRNNISVPTIPALARARRHLDQRGRQDITVIVTGGLRTPDDFAKAMALGADGIAVSNAAIQAIGCLAMRACHTNNCPVGIATQKPHLRKRLPINEASERLARFFGSSVDLMKILARACGHTRLGELCIDDLTTWKREMADLSGVAYGGVGS